MKDAASAVIVELGGTISHQHGVGRYAGMVKRTIGGVERDYLLLEYKGGDKLADDFSADPERLKDFFAGKTG